jgi:hypothetical protein
MTLRSLFATRFYEGAGEEGHRRAEAELEGESQALPRRG